MKYNVTKSDVTNRKQIIQFYGKGLSENEAINMLFELHDSEKQRMFQDVSELLTDSNGMMYFEVCNNKIIYRYEIELSQFEMFAVMFRNELCKN